MNSATIAAMAGGGQYNRHSRLQLANLQSRCPCGSTRRRPWGRTAPAS
ncbi:hypothetical protein [Novosphingobium resinovorum]